MDAHDLHIKPGESLLDKIAADPDIINRPMGGVSAQGPVSETSTASDEASGKLVLLHPDEHFPVEAPATHGHRLVLLLITAGVLMVLSGGGAAAYFSFRPAPAAVTETPTVTPTPTPSPSESATPEPTPEPTPTPLPTGSVPYGSTPTPAPTPKMAGVLSASDVPAPEVTPSASDPQIVTVQNKSGLWLRSTADSSSKNNIVAWVPNGAQMSVDSLGDFWGHGTYNGKSGYFAVSYTK